MNVFTDTTDLLMFDSNHSEFFSNIKFFKRIKKCDFCHFSKERNITAGNQIKCFGNTNDNPICSNMFNKPEKRPLLRNTL